VIFIFFKIWMSAALLMMLAALAKLWFAIDDAPKDIRWFIRVFIIIVTPAPIGGIILFWALPLK
jgi:hypothetical protein